MKKHLKSQYGFSNFRDYQEEIIQDILDGNDAIVIFPTGGGKSLCYQFPATYLNKKSIVVSPLISLMTDQQLHLTQRGIKCVCLNSESKTVGRSLLNSNRKVSSEIDDANVIYCTPEYLDSNMEMFKKLKDICLFAIDEAHCLSEWGHDFRPSYRQLNRIKKEFPSTPIVALTATATPQVLDDIFNVLGLSDANQYQLGSMRKNLSIHIKEKSGDILADLDINPEESTIVYTQTRKNAEKIYNLLKSSGIQVGYYHAGLSPEHKHKTHDKFVKDKIKVIVATICFGMGIDKPDIRKVVNYGSPCNLETYYQEIGRAGRDGMPSEVVMFHSDADYGTNSFLLSKSNTKQSKHELLNIFQKYIMNSTNCRQVMIEHYFENGNLSGTISNTNKCGTCDNCTGSNKSMASSTTNVLREATLITGLINSLSVNYGITKLICILRGMGDKFTTNRYYNTGGHKSVDWWKKLINVLVQEDYLSKKPYSFYTVIDIGCKDIDNTENLDVCLPNDKRNSPVSSKKYKTIRNHLAKLHNVSPYMIANDKVLYNICVKNPNTLTELFDIDGVSNDFICKYGSFFVSDSVSDSASDSVKNTVKNPSKNSGSTTKDESYSLYQQGKTIKEICGIRGLTITTVESHIISKLTVNTDEIDKDRIGITDTVLKRISQAVSEVGKDRLRPIKDVLDNEKGGKLSYFQIKVALILL